MMLVFSTSFVCIPCMMLCNTDRITDACDGKENAISVLYKSFIFAIYCCEKYLYCNGHSGCEIRRLESSTWTKILAQAIEIFTQFSTKYCYLSV